MKLDEPSERSQDLILEKDSEIYQAPPRPSTARKKVLFGILGLAIAILAFLKYQERILVADAAPLAEKVMEEFKEPGLDVASQLTVTRDLLFFGTPHAKVEVFIRPVDGDDSHSIHGIEYHYVLNNNEWQFQDSGSCTSEECALRGRAAFDAK